MHPAEPVDALITSKHYGSADHSDAPDVNLTSTAPLEHYEGATDREYLGQSRISHALDISWQVHEILVDLAFASSEEQLCGVPKNVLFGSPS